MQKKSSQKNRQALITLICTALLIALQVVLSRFLSIYLGNIKIGFSFIPVILAARLFGPLYSVLVYGVGDLIGSLLFPVGAYYPGFTVSAALSGLIFGLLLNKKSTKPRMVLAAVLNQLLCSFLLNSFFLSQIYGTAYTAQLAVRWPQSLGMCAVQIILMLIGLERICRPLEKSLGLRGSAA